MCELANTREAPANHLKYRLLPKMAGIFFWIYVYITTHPQSNL